MTLQELKTFLDGLTPEQLTQQAIVFKDDEEQGNEIDHWNITDEDVFWEHHGDCLGNLEQTKATLGDEYENEKDDLIKVPMGTISFYTL